MVNKNSEFKTAKLYAKALYESAQTDDVAAHILNDVETLKNLDFVKIPETACFSSPIVGMNVKMSLVETISDKLGLCLQTQNFLKLLIENNKFKSLELIINDFFVLYNQKHNIAEVVVETVKELNDEQNARLCEKLATVFNKKIKINYLLKPEIFGGLVIKNGTTLIDLSLKNKLKKLEQLMKGTD